jgi:hypothetical protein
MDDHDDNVNLLALLGRFPELATVGIMGNVYRGGDVTIERAAVDGSVVSKDAYIFLPRISLFDGDFYQIDPLAIDGDQVKIIQDRFPELRREITYNYKYQTLVKILNHTGWKTYTCGSRAYYNINGELQSPNRSDQAVIKSNGGREWYQNGLLHRIDGPAYIYANGEKWYRNGKLHRDDGPAFDNVSSTRWYQDDQLHRIGGPAVVKKDGSWWYQNDQLHRDDGPAIINKNGERWYQHDQLHRDDGPAVINKDGKKLWYQYGQLHRIT